MKRAPREMSVVVVATQCIGVFFLFGSDKKLALHSLNDDLINAVKSEAEALPQMEELREEYFSALRMKDVAKQKSILKEIISLNPNSLFALRPYHDLCRMLKTEGDNAQSAEIAIEGLNALNKIYEKYRNQSFFVLCIDQISALNYAFETLPEDIYAKEIAFCNEVSSDHPDFKDIVLLTAIDVEICAKKYDRALELCDEVERINETLEKDEQGRSSTIELRSIILEKLNRPDEAISVLTREEKGNPVYLELNREKSNRRLSLLQYQQEKKLKAAKSAASTPATAPGGPISEAGKSGM